MKTAVIQFNAGSNKKDNIVKAVGLVEQCIRKGAEFIALPEAFPFRGRVKEHLPSLVEDIPGDSTQPLQKLAQTHKVIILAGSIYEREADKAYNTSVLINDRGEIAAQYRKINLFDLDLPGKRIREADYFLAGQKLVTTPVKNFSVGLSICYDLRFPDLYQRYRQQGVDILCVPSAFTHETGKAHWKILLQARAIENLCYVVAPNQCGGGGDITRCYGHSLIVSPWGEILAEASEDKEEIIFADLEKRIIQERRAILPVFLNKKLTPNKFLTDSVDEMQKVIRIQRVNKKGVVW